MSISFSIRVVDNDGDPIDGANVTIRSPGFMGLGSMSYHGFTDSDGWAEYEVDDVSSLDIEQVSVSKGANSLGTVDVDLRVEDGDTESITVS